MVARWAWRPTRPGGTIVPIENVVECIEVNSTRDDAFHRFIDELQHWWPRDYTFSRDVLAALGIEAKLGGFCFEIGPHGFRCDWGRVVDFEPPQRVAFLWQLTPRSAPQPDPDKASLVTLDFAATPAGTKVRLEHSGFERHGDGAEKYRDELASEYGWAFILQKYGDYCGRAASAR